MNDVLAARGEIRFERVAGGEWLVASEHGAELRRNPGHPMKVPLEITPLGEEVIEGAVVACADRREVAEGKQHPLAQPAWRGLLQAAGTVEPDVARVAGEQLVAPFPGEDNGDRLARKLADQVRREGRGIGDGLVHVPGELGEQLGSVGLDDQLVVLSAKVADDTACLLQFVVNTREIEADRERSYRLIARLSHHGAGGARV